MSKRTQLHQSPGFAYLANVADVYGGQTKHNERVDDEGNNAVGSASEGQRLRTKPECIDAMEMRS